MRVFISWQTLKITASSWCRALIDGRPNPADPTSVAYARIARQTRWYSWLTTGVVVVIIILMVAKPF